MEKSSPKALGNLPPQYTLKEVAEYLRIQYKTLAANVKRNPEQWYAVQLNRRWLISEPNLERLLAGEFGDEYPELDGLL